MRRLWTPAPGPGDHRWLRDLALSSGVHSMFGSERCRSVVYIVCVVYIVYSLLLRGDHGSKGGRGAAARGRRPRSAEDEQAKGGSDRTP